jgi:hypothetical protein
VQVSGIIKPDAKGGTPIGVNQRSQWKAEAILLLSNLHTATNKTRITTQARAVFVERLIGPGLACAWMRQALSMSRARSLSPGAEI